MSNQPHNVSKISFFKKAVIFFGGIIAPIFVIYSLTKTTEITTEAPAVVTERIKPIAEVVVSAESGPHIDKSGEEVVKGSCSACHSVGAMGSPKIGDKSAWGARIAQGYETLVKNAIEGIRTMPARGGNPDLSDHEIASAVAYMANQSGAKFTEPKPAMPAK